MHPIWNMELADISAGWNHRTYNPRICFHHKKQLWSPPDYQTIYQQSHGFLKYSTLHFLNRRNIHPYEKPTFPYCLFPFVFSFSSWISLFWLRLPKNQLISNLDHSFNKQPIFWFKLRDSLWRRSQKMFSWILATCSLSPSLPLFPWPVSCRLVFNMLNLNSIAQSCTEPSPLRRKRHGIWY